MSTPFVRLGRMPSSFCPSALWAVSFSVLGEQSSTELACLKDFKKRFYLRCVRWPTSSADSISPERKKVNLKLATQWDRMIARGPDASLAAIQSALLGQTFGLLLGVCPLPAKKILLLYGIYVMCYVWRLTYFCALLLQRPKDLAGIEAFHGSIIAVSFGNPIFSRLEALKC